MATIELVNIAHAYSPNQYAVQDINLKWEEGVSSALLGPSGCGKTTLLKIISGLLKPTEGDVLLDGKRVNDLSPKDRNIAQVFQFPVVYETLNVFNNLAFPLRNRGIPEPQVKERVHIIAEILELTDILKKNSASLSAAEKQLISLGRGVVREDMAGIMLDEPLTVIDPYQKFHIRRKLKQLQRELELTMIYVTHDQHEALTFAEQVTVMNTGEALQTGSPRDLHARPKAPFVGYFIGSPGMNIFEASLKGQAVQAGEFSIDVPDAIAQNLHDKNLKIGVRPEFVKVYRSQQPNTFAGVITAAFLTGSARILDISGAGLQFKVRVEDTSSLRANEDVWVEFPMAKTMLYANERAVELPQEEHIA